MEEELREYLDKAIRRWREVLKDSKDEKNKLVAKCYIDAYQSVRLSILGKILFE